MVEKSIQDFRGFCAATQGMQETEGSSTDKNGEDAAEQQSRFLGNFSFKHFLKLNL